MKTKYKIGYIDEDINQVKKYQRRFRKYGFEVIGYDFEDEMSLEELMKQVYESDIDLLMIDYKLDETNKVTFNGDKVESEFFEKRPLFPHIIFTNKIDDAEPHVEDWNLIFEKDLIFSEDEDDEKNVQHFITTLEKSIERYKNTIEKKKNKIASLIEKGESEGINSSEQDTLISLQRELGDLDKTKKKEVPEKLISSEKLEDLSKTRKEAEEFLQSLIEKNRKK
jgi:hypothetical protein